MYTINIQTLITTFIILAIDSTDVIHNSCCICNGDGVVCSCNGYDQWRRQGHEDGGQK